MTKPITPEERDLLRRMPEIAERLRCGLGERVERTFGDRVREVVRIRPCRAPIRHVDNCSLDILGESPGERLRQEHGAPEVHRERSLPLLRGHVEERVLREGRRAVDQHANRREVTGACNDLRRIGRVPEVGPDQTGLDTFGRDLGSRLLGGRSRRVVVEHDVRPCIGESEHDGSADTMGAPRHERSDSAKIHGHRA